MELAVGPLPISTSANEAITRRRRPAKRFRLDGRVDVLGPRGLQIRRAEAELRAHQPLDPPHERHRVEPVVGHGARPGAAMAVGVPEPEADEPRTRVRIRRRLRGEAAETPFGGVVLRHDDAVARRSPEVERGHGVEGLDRVDVQVPDRGPRAGERRTRPHRLLGADARGEDEDVRPLGELARLTHADRRVEEPRDRPAQGRRIISTVGRPPWAGCVGPARPHAPPGRGDRPPGARRALGPRGLLRRAAGRRDPRGAARRRGVRGRRLRRRPIGTGTGTVGPPASGRRARRSS